MQGHPVDREIPVNMQAARAAAAPVAAGIDNGGMVVAWTSASGDIHGQIFNATGQAVRGEFLINSATPNTESHPAITATSDGGFFVTWTSTGATGADIHAQRYDSTGA